MLGKPSLWTFESWALLWNSASCEPPEPQNAQWPLTMCTGLTWAKSGTAGCHLNLWPSQPVLSCSLFRKVCWFQSTYLRWLSMSGIFYHIPCQPQQNCLTCWNYLWNCFLALNGKPLTERWYLTFPREYFFFFCYISTEWLLILQRFA